VSCSWSNKILADGSFNIFQREICRRWHLCYSPLQTDHGRQPQCSHHSAPSLSLCIVFDFDPYYIMSKTSSFPQNASQWNLGEVYSSRGTLPLRDNVYLLPRPQNWNMLEATLHCYYYRMDLRTRRIPTRNGGGTQLSEEQGGRASGGILWAFPRNNNDPPPGYSSTNAFHTIQKCDH